MGQTRDHRHLRDAIALSEAARKHGNMPFGAVLVAPDGTVLARSENTIITDRDMTAHAEINALRAASKHCTPQEVAAATMYASGEPCPMCSGAMMRMGLRRLVFGIRASVAMPYLSPAAGAMASSVSCRDVLRLAPAAFEVHGPVLEVEAKAPFEKLAAGNAPSPDQAVLNEIGKEGYAVVPGTLPDKMLALLKQDLEEAIEREAAYHGGTGYADYGMVMVCCAQARSFVDVLASQAVMGVVNQILGEGSIIYAYTSSSMPPGRSNYSRRIHVDSPRIIPGYETNLGVMLLLDDFTAENGATWMLPRSHRTTEPPSEEFFAANAKRVIAPAGSAVYFNPRVWHSGGRNETDRWRHSLTLNMCRGYMKQRLDIPKIMALSPVDLASADEKTLQKMGFYAQVPESLDEYYLPPEKRKFRQKAE